MNRAWFGVLFIWTAASFAFRLDSMIIKGHPVEPGTYKEVVAISSLGYPCTATIVGPRVLVTAAQCASNGDKAEFTYNGTKYLASFFRSPLFPVPKEHNIAVAITDVPIAGATPATIGGVPTKGLGIKLLGYGCDQPEGKLGEILQYGETLIDEIQPIFYISRKPGGAALCYGDSGGPAFVEEGGKRLLIGVHFKTDMVEKNWDVRIDSPETKNFFNSIVTTKGVEICGVMNKDCSGVVVPPPTCELAAIPAVINLGQSLVLKLTPKGNVTSATIAGEPVLLSELQKTITPTDIGNFMAEATVTGSGVTSKCMANYTVNPVVVEPAPTCTLTLSNSSIKLGNPITATLSASAKATSATIEGKKVDVPVGTYTWTPASAGSQMAVGTVTGLGGSSTCSQNYFVEGESPNIPNFAVTPTFCGDNIVTENPVRQVCLGLVKYSYQTRDLNVKEVVMIEMNDGSRQVLPIILRRNRSNSSRGNEVVEDITTYANGTTVIQGNLALDVRVAQLSSSSSGVPLSIRGRSAGMVSYTYVVEELKRMR